METERTKCKTGIILNISAVLITYSVLYFVPTHVHLRMKAAEKVCVLSDPQYRYAPFQV